MPDSVPGLPDPVAPPSFPANEEAYDRTRAAAHRRRRRQLARTGGGATTLAAVLVGALLLPGPGGPQVLGPAAGTTPAATGEPTGDPTSDPSPVAGSATPTATGAPQPLATLLGLLPSSTRSPRPEPSGTAQPEPSASPDTDPPASEPPPAGEPVRGPEPALTSYDASRVCDGSGPTNAVGYCSYYDGQRSAPRGSVVELAAAVCRLPGRGEGALRAGSGEYAAFNVGTSEDGTLWQWRTGRRFAPEPRTFTVPEGSCLRFAVSWDLTGHDGRGLPAGEYRLDARPYVTPEGIQATVNNVEDFTIT